MSNSRRPFRTGTKRITAWAGIADQGFIAVASAGATLINSLTLGEPGTIVRVRGMVSVNPQALGASVAVVGAVGMGIVSAQAFAAGVGSMPEPFSDAEWGGWLVWRSFGYFLNVTSDIGRLMPDWNFEVDSKAMRKVGENEVLVTIAESQGGAFNISTPLRTLVKFS